MAGLLKLSHVFLQSANLYTQTSSKSLPSPIGRLEPYWSSNATSSLTQPNGEIIPVQLLAGAKVEEVLVQVVLVVGVQEVFYDSSTGLEMRSVLAVFSTLEKDALRCNHCGFSSLGCERAGYGSREVGQYECQYQSDCQSAYCPAETMNQAVLCFPAVERV